VSDSPSPTLRVLVVDDDPDISASTRGLLKLLGHEAEAAVSGKAALERAAAWRPDVALIDLRMPVMDGLELARQLRRLGGMGGALLVAVTAQADQEEMAQARQAGFDLCLLKPLDLSQLEELLRNYALTRDTKDEGPAAG
jgi:two-component system, chemotaxis family, CheB/CheR fusion protein